MGWRAGRNRKLEEPVRWTWPERKEKLGHVLPSLLTPSIISSPLKKSVHEPVSGVHFSVPYKL